MSVRTSVGIFVFALLAGWALIAGHATLLIFALPPLILVIVRKRTLPILLSPVWITAGVLWLLGVVGWLTYPYLQGADGGGLRIFLAPEMADETAWLIGISVTFLTLGSALGVAFRPRLPTVFGLKPIDIKPQFLPWLLAASLIPIGMILLDTPPEVLWLRPRYQMYVAVAPVAVLGHQLAVGAVPVLGFLYVKQKGAARVLIILATITYLLLFFSYGSRRLAMLPIMFALGGYAASMSKAAARWLIVGAVLSALMLPIPLYIRGLDSHGLQPYFAALPSIFQDGPSWKTTISNIMVFFPITALTAYGIPMIPTDSLLLELNPLPGELVGWYDISGTMGLNRATPYSGIGELGNAGWLWVALVWMIVGIVIAVLERWVHRALLNGQQVLAVAIVGLAGLFAVTVTQYNFRSAQRELIYALAVAAIVAFLAHRKRSVDLLENRFSPFDDASSSVGRNPTARSFAPED